MDTPLRTGLLLLLLCAFLGTTPILHADELIPQKSKRYKIALIIDDLGYNKSTGKRVIALPGDITCSFIPFLPHSKTLARQANRAGKEVMLHMPMQAQSHPHRLAGGLTIDMNQHEIGERLRLALNAIPHVAGINNHMGSLLTTHSSYMRRVMAEMLRSPDLYFVDSYTIHNSIAMQVAQELGIPSVRRQVFLDHDPSPEAIAKQFERVLRIARKHDSVIAIGHPHRSTLSFLEEWLPKLERLGFDLVPVSWLANTNNQEYRLWQASLSR